MFGRVMLRAGWRALVALRKPWVSVILFVVLLIDGCSLPRTTTLGRIWNPIRYRCCGCCWSPQAFVVNTSGGLSLVSENPESSIDYDATVAVITCNTRRQTGG